mmetsp:Transcript_93760/g.201295  ORF Transcript_93760/g.201295 Transcript_93760/m.201295 type:complete len:203 (-) Transcript_93760:173-781(-)
MPAHGLEGHHGIREDVGLLRILSALHHLGRHPMHRPHALGHGLVLRACEAKIRELDDNLGVWMCDFVQKHEVQALQVAVQYLRVEVVEVVHGGSGVIKNSQALVPGQGNFPMVVQQVKQGAPIAVLEYDLQGGHLENQANKSQDVLVDHLAQHAQLPPHSLGGVLVQGVPNMANFLHRYLLALVSRKVDHSRDALADGVSDG